MDMNLIMQGLSMGMGLAVILFLFFLVQYLYTGFKKISTRTTNRNIHNLLKLDKQLEQALVNIELSIYSITLSLSTAYILTIVS